MRRLFISSLLLLATACASANGAWRDLLASDVSAWRGYKSDTLPSGWQFDAASGVLTRVTEGGDVITREEFSDFEFEVDWKLTPGANSGIFFRAGEGTDRIYENATEYQVLDNSRHPDGRNPLTSAGSNFALYAATSDVTKPVGEWNTTRIIARGAHVEHWLNGTKVLAYDLWTPAWSAAVAASKFRQWPTYGLAKRGHIGLQDHGNVVSFRHARIRELTP